MTPKARHMRNSLHERTISVDELFAAAFKKSKFFYQRESLLGWRPVTNDYAQYKIDSERQSSFRNKSSLANSPDINVHETAESIFIEVMLPEIDEESLYLEVSGDLLIIRAKKVNAGTKNSGRSEKTDGSLVHRFVKLPVAAQPGNVQARLENSLLKVIINKPWTELREE